MCGTLPHIRWVHARTREHRLKFFRTHWRKNCCTRKNECNHTCSVTFWDWWLSIYLIVPLNQIERFAQCGKDALSTMLHQAICKFLEILGLDSDAYDNDDVEKTWAKRTLFDQKMGSNWRLNGLYLSGFNQKKTRLNWLKKLLKSREKVYSFILN